jgi:hypothetical protein
MPLVVSTVAAHFAHHGPRCACVQQQLRGHNRHCSAPDEQATAPIHNGTYCCKRTTTVQVRIPLQAGVRARDLDVLLTKGSVRVSLVGEVDQVSSPAMHLTFPMRAHCTSSETAHPLMACKHFAQRHSGASHRLCFCCLHAAHMHTTFTCAQPPLLEGEWCGGRVAADDSFWTTEEAPDGTWQLYLHLEKVTLIDTQLLHAR